MVGSRKDPERDPLLVNGERRGMFTSFSASSNFYTSVSISREMQSLDQIYKQIGVVSFIGVRGDKSGKFGAGC